MRLAFTGKGGSGKTTISSLFARQMAMDGHAVLAFDADINQHLAAALEVSAPLESMGERFDDIKKYLAGSNARFTAEQMHKTTPPGRGSNFVRLRDDDWFVREFALRTAEGIRVAGAGEIPPGNVGVRCYHGLNGAVELVLGHMLDTPDDVVVVDMTAGADAFSSSLFAKVDALVLVAEPTRKSLDVFEQFRPHAERYGVPLFVVGNKIEDDDDRRFVEETVGSLAACFAPSAYVKRRDRGETVAFDLLDPAIVAGLRQLQQAAMSVGRDWDELERRSHVMHRRNAEGWMGNDVLGHIDPDFSLKRAAQGS